MKSVTAGKISNILLFAMKCARRLTKHTTIFLQNFASDKHFFANTRHCTFVKDKQKQSEGKIDTNFTKKSFIDFLLVTNRLLCRAYLSRPNNNNLKAQKKGAPNWQVNDNRARFW